MYKNGRQSKIIRFAFWNCDKGSTSGNRYQKPQVIYRTQQLLRIASQRPWHRQTSQVALYLLLCFSSTSSVISNPQCNSVCRITGLILASSDVVPAAMILLHS